MRKIILVLFGLITSIFMISIVNAEILLNQPSGIYNFGDNINIKVNINSISDANGFFTMDLVCNNSYNFYKIPLSMKAGESKTIETNLLLDNSYPNGVCDIRADYNGEERISQGFRISNIIQVSLDYYDISVEAGKKINIQGSAMDENGKKTSGYVELSIDSIGVKTSGQVDGNFSVDFSLPDNTKSGDYTLKVRVYEKYKDIEVNSGEASVNIYVKQTPKKVDISVLDKSFNPEEQVDIAPTILDQAGDSMQGTVGLKIIDVNNNPILQKVVESGENVSLILDGNATPGLWTIETNFLNITNSKQFNVAEYEKADFNIQNNTLTITNIGNVIYRKSIEIGIGNYSEIKNVELQVGESMKLLLSGNGDYQISVNDGKTSLNMPATLTGGVVGIEEVTRTTSIFLRYPFVWLFFILVAGLFIMTLLRKTAKRASISYPVSEKSFKPVSSVKLSENVNSGVVRINGPVNLREAEHVPVLDGRKEQASIVAVKIRNYDAVRKIEQVQKIQERIQEKGSVYLSPGFIIGLFSSPTTRTFDNEIIALHVTRDIDSILSSYNKLARVKIDYGIGVHAGELLVKKDNNLKFAPLGNILSMSKKIADSISEGYLLSPSINSKVIGEVKTEKASIPGIEAYKVKGFTERNQHEKFISGFLERQRK